MGMLSSEAPLKKTDGPRLLLIDDNPVEANLLREQLLSNGRPFELKVIQDVDEAIDFLSLQKKKGGSEKPDVVILDLNLPKRSGFDVLKELKQGANNKDLPVLVLTTSQQTSDIVQSYALYANAFMTKPSTLEGYTPVIETIYSLHDQFSVLHS